MKGERIVGFEIHIRSGRVAQMPNIPIGWNVSVDNDPSWNTDIKGSIDVGAAASGPDLLRNIMVFEVEKDALPDEPFDLQGAVVVTSDFKTERRITLSMKDFVTKRRRVAQP